MGQEQLHVLPFTMSNSSCRQVDVVFTKNGIHTVVDVVIANPTQVNLFFQSCTIQRFVAFNATQAKERGYHNWHPTNPFLPLAIEVFGCLHKQINVFLHNCANAIWSFKRFESLPLSILVIFLHQKNPVTLQMMQESSILSWVIMVGLVTSRLLPLQSTPLIPTTNLLQAIDCWNREIFWHLVGANLASFKFSPSFSFFFPFFF